MYSLRGVLDLRAPGPAGSAITIFGDGTQIRSLTYVKGVVNINKLKALGFEFQTDFRSGLAQTLESVKQYVRG